MPQLFGRAYARGDLQRLTSTLSQVAGVRMLERADGKARGLRQADVYTGSGFRFEVLLDRAMDIGAAEFGGRPLAWLHPALGPPAQFEPQGRGWLRTFGGGLVTTCGLTHIGQPDSDAGEEFGLHGRISHIPADHVQVSEAWSGDEYVISISGQMRQAVLFGENLLLTRSISTRLGANQFTLKDVVRNEGYRSTPHMMLYHCNFGFPVVSPDSALLIEDESVEARDEAALRGLSEHTQFGQPMPDFAEQVYIHRPQASADGFARAAIVNRALNFGASVRYRLRELPYLWQWKMMGAGEYVCGLEPTNHPPTPHSQLRAQGNLRMIEPGEEIEYWVEIDVLEGEDEYSSIDVSR